MKSSKQAGQQRAVKVRKESSKVGRFSDKIQPVEVVVDRKLRAKRRMNEILKEERIRFGFKDGRKIRKLKKNGKWSTELKKKNEIAGRDAEREARRRFIEEGVREKLWAHAEPVGEEDAARKEIQNEPLLLVSRRGTRLGDKLRFCSNCAARWSTVWEYSESNWGVVWLCAFCKRLVFDRSFHHIDAMTPGIRVGRKRRGKDD